MPTREGSGAGMTGFEKQRFMAELRAQAKRSSRRWLGHRGRRSGEIRPYLFRFEFNARGKRWRLRGLWIDDWHWFDKCTDIFQEGNVHRFWLAWFLLIVRVSPL